MCSRAWAAAPPLMAGITPRAAHNITTQQRFPVSLSPVGDGRARVEVPEKTGKNVQMPEKSEDGHQFRRGVSRLRELANARLATRVRKPLPDERGSLPRSQYASPEHGQRSASRLLAREGGSHVEAMVVRACPEPASAGAQRAKHGAACWRYPACRVESPAVRRVHRRLRPCLCLLLSPKAAEAPQGMTGTARQIARPMPDKDRPHTAIH